MQLMRSATALMTTRRSTMATLCSAQAPLVGETRLGFMARKRLSVGIDRRRLVTKPKRSNRRATLFERNSPIGQTPCRPETGDQTPITPFSSAFSLGSLGLRAATIIPRGTYCHVWQRIVLTCMVAYGSARQGSVSGVGGPPPRLNWGPPISWLSVAFTFTIFEGQLGTFLAPYGFRPLLWGPGLPCRKNRGLLRLRR